MPVSLAQWQRQQDPEQQLLLFWAPWTPTPSPVPPRRNASRSFWICHGQFESSGFFSTAKGAGWCAGLQSSLHTTVICNSYHHFRALWQTGKRTGLSTMAPAKRREQRQRHTAEARQLPHSALPVWKLWFLAVAVALWERDTLLMCFSFWKIIEELCGSTASRTMCYRTEQWTPASTEIWSALSVQPAEASADTLSSFSATNWTCLDNLQICPAYVLKCQVLKHNKLHLIFQVSFLKVILKGGGRCQINFNQYGSTFVLQTPCFLKVNNIVTIQNIIYSLKEESSVINYCTVKVIFNF